MPKQPGGIPAKVEQLVRPAVEDLGLRLWDVRYEKEGTEWYLRVFIDRDEPLDTNICEAASRAIDPLLDEADPIEHGYCLEVGSPGLGRKLTRDEHFAAKAGQQVRVKLYGPDEQGRREITGTLLEKNGNDVLLLMEEGQVRIPFKSASAFKLCDDENLFG